MFVIDTLIARLYLPQFVARNAYQIVVILLCCILKHNLVEFKSLFVIYIVNIYSQTWNSKLYQ